MTENLPENKGESTVNPAAEQWNDATTTWSDSASQELDKPKKTGDDLHEIGSEWYGGIVTGIGGVEPDNAKVNQTDVDPAQQEYQSYQDRLSK